MPFFLAQNNWPTREERLRAALGVLHLVADLLDLQTVAPDFARHSLSSAASATLAAFRRQHAEELQQEARAEAFRAGFRETLIRV